MFVIDLIGGLLLSTGIIMGIGLLITLPLNQRYPNLITSHNIGWLLVVSLVVTFLLQTSDDSKLWGFSESLYEANLAGGFT